MSVLSWLTSYSFVDSGDERLLEPIGYSPAGKVIGREFNGHLVPRKDFNEMHPHLTGDVCQDLVSILHLKRKHGVGKRLQHGALHFYGIFFRHHPPELLAITVAWWSES